MEFAIDGREFIVNELPVIVTSRVIVLVYLDSNIVIYLIEDPPDFGERAVARIAELRAQQDEVVVSDLTRVECRSQPLADGDHATLEDYDEFFNRSAAQVVDLTTAVCDRATEIRAFHRFKTPDALHLAAAIEAGCNRFLTNDHRLSGFSDIPIEVLP